MAAARTIYTEQWFQSQA